MGTNMMHIRQLLCVILLLMNNYCCLAFFPIISSKSGVKTVKKDILDLCSQVSRGLTETKQDREKMLSLFESLGKMIVILILQYLLNG